MSKKLFVTIVVMLMFAFTEGFFAGVSLKTPLADEMRDTLSVYTRITYLSDTDINSLLQQMDPDILSRTLEELPDSYSAKALVSTYLCNDPFFEGVLRNY